MLNTTKNLKKNFYLNKILYIYPMETIRERLLRDDNALWGEVLGAWTNGTSVIYNKIDSEEFIILSSFMHQGELFYIISVDGRKEGTFYVASPKDIIIQDKKENENK